MEPLGRKDATLSTLRKVMSALGQSAWSLDNTCQSSISGWELFDPVNLPWAAMTLPYEFTGVFLLEADI